MTSLLKAIKMNDGNLPELPTPRLRWAIKRALFHAYPTMASVAYEANLKARGTVTSKGYYEPYLSAAECSALESRARHKPYLTSM